MKRSFLLCLVLAAMAWNVQADGLHDTKLGVHTGTYFEPKLIMTMGETISHGESTLSGDIGYGIGYDLGYSFTENFALELDGTYSKSDVTETLSTGEIVSPIVIMILGSK